MKRSVVAVIAAAALSLAGVTAPVEGASGSAPRVEAAAPGLAGSAIVLASQKSLLGWDIAMGPDGTAYVGWIAASAAGAADRTVYLCVLPKGATACQGGTKATSSLDGASAAGIQVLPPVGASPVTLVWFHDTGNSISTPLGAKIATSTLVGGSLTAAVDQAAAYSFGRLETAERGPGGAIWAVLVQASGAGDEFRILPGLAGTPKVINPPWLVDNIRLAFASGKAVVVFDEYGPITAQIRVVHQPTTTTWSSIAAVPGTWDLGGAYDIAAQGGVKLVAPINNASYYPRIANWTGSSFGAFALTGDKNSCAPSSHDLFPDASGRLADVALECGQLAVGNHPKARTGAFVRFSLGGTAAGGDPQIGTTPRGLGWVAWGRLAPTAQTLLVAPIRLPAQRTSRSNGSTYGVVTATGPVSCLPAVQTTIGVKAAGRNGWSVVSKTLKLDGSLHTAGLNGANLAAGSTHTVTGSAKFRKNGVTRSLSASLTFKSCPNP